MKKPIKIGLDAFVIVAERAIDDAESHEEMDAIGDAMLRLSASIATGAAHDEPPERSRAAWLRECAERWDSAVRDAAEFRFKTTAGGKA